MLRNTPQPARPGAGGIGHRERRKQETRAALVGAALRLIAERGMDQTTVEEISTAANVSTRTFFNYFSCKEDAVTQAGAEAVERICDRVRVTCPEMSAIEAVRLAMLTEMETLDENPSALRQQLTIVERSPALWPRLVASGEVMMQDLTNVIAERVGVDPARHEFPGLLASVALAVSRSAMIRWHQVDHERPLTEFLDQAFEMLIIGLPDPA